MTVALAFTHRTVDDVDEALGFYRDALGPVVLNDVCAGEGRWVSIAADTAKGSVPMIGFSTDGVDGLFERIAASGAEVLQEPVDLRSATVSRLE